MGPGQAGFASSKRGRLRRLTTGLTAGFGALLAVAGAMQLAAASPAAAATGSGAVTVTVTASPSTVSPGSPVTLSASVVSADGGPVPTGSVVFFIGGSQVGTTDCTASNGQPADCLDASGTASTQLSNVASGSYQVYASYSGDSNYARLSYLRSVPGTFTVSTQTVDNTTTTLQAPTAPFAANQQESLVASVVDQNNQAVTSGTVTFFNLTTNATVGYASLNSGGVATYVSSTWPVGTFDIEATYVGPITFGSSAASAQITVTNSVTIDNTTTTLAISPPTITMNQSTVLEADVVDQTSTPVTSGWVTFFNTTTNSTIGKAPISNGVADLLTSNWPAGTFGIEATYEGPITMAPSGYTGTLSVLKVSATTATTVTSVSPSPALVDQPVTITAAVSSNESTQPTGTVTFYADGNSIGTAPLSSSETATLTLPSGLAAGTYQITASYSGDRVDDASGQSPPVQLVVNDLTTTTTPAISPSPSVFGESVALSASVTAQTGTPSGSVTFYLTSLSGPVLCTATLSGGTGSCSTAALASGSDTVVASYSGDSLDNPSSATATTTVDPAPSTTAVTATPQSSVAPEQVTLSANVASASGLATVPTGSVTFSLGTATGPTLCVVALSGGSASCNTTALPVGVDTIVASYGGDSNYSVSSGTTSASVDRSVVVDVSGSQDFGSASPSFTYTAALPSGVSLSGTLTCQSVDGGTAISATLPVGSHTIDGSSCTGLSAPNTVVSYVGVTDGFVVSNPTPGTCSYVSIPPGATPVTGSEHGDIVVGSGQSLYIAGGDVSGDITLLKGAQLIMTSGTIGGHLWIAKGDPVTITGGTVHGGLETFGSPVALCGGSVEGHVEVHGGSLMVENTAIDGGIRTEGAGWVAITGSQIEGDVVAAGTSSTPPATVSQANPAENYVCATRIDGNLDLAENTAAAPFEIGSGPDCTAPDVVTGRIIPPGSSDGERGGGEGGSGGCHHAHRDDKAHEHHGRARSDSRRSPRRHGRS